MKIGFFEIDNLEKEYFLNKFPSEHELYFFEDPINRADIKILEKLEVAATFIYSRLDWSVLNTMPCLRYITTRSTGFDHIDIEACRKKNILVSNVPTYAAITVAEHTFALILALSRRITESYEKVKNGIFSPENLMGFELYGKTLGIIGAGNIGKHVIGIARCFNLRILVYSQHEDKKLAEELGFSFVDIDTLLASSDIISLHLPYTPETHHFLNRERFAKVKPGAVIINTARGALIDTAALMQALTENKIKGAGLDVLEEEPFLKEEKELLSKEFKKEQLMNILEDQILLHDARVVITPHNAFNSEESLKRLLDSTVDNIKSFVLGRAKNLIRVS